MGQEGIWTVLHDPEGRGETLSFTVDADTDKYPGLVWLQLLCMVDDANPPEDFGEPVEPCYHSGCTTELITPADARMLASRLVAAAGLAEEAKR